MVCCYGGTSFSTCNDDISAPMRRVLIREMEALGERGVAVDSLESLKQTHDRETAKLVALTYAIAESLAGIHEKERHLAKFDLND
nr:glycoside hydrolase, family 79 [Tanacetum cinerariifolium]